MLTEAIGWLIVLAVLLVIEIATLGLTTIWFAGGAIVAFLVALFGGSLVVQSVIFFAVSIVLLFTMRPAALRRFNSKRIATNVDSLVGTTGKVLEQIDNFNETGVVLADGKEWTARTEDEHIIPEGAKVTIQKVAGVKLIVTDKKEEVM